MTNDKATNDESSVAKAAGGEGGGELEYARPQGRREQESRVGIAALWCALIGFVILLLVFEVTMTLKEADGKLRANLSAGFEEQRGVINFIVVTGLLVSAAGLVMGVIGVAQRTHGRRWGLAGLMVAALTLVAAGLSW